MSSYADKYDRQIELVDMTDAEELAVKIVMKEGELRFRDAAVSFFEEDVKSYLDEVDGEPNIEWVEGVRYCIKMIREGDFGVNK
jgi:hypothetical protein